MRVEAHVIGASIGGVGVAGMGHDLPPGVIEHILAPLLPHLDCARTAA